MMALPLLEEKLVCPLALRFTQEEIKSTFDDGPDLNESVKQIQSKPGADGYDFILEAPFPKMQIIRCTEVAEVDAQHWFALGNRRLYCLQRVAASLWPKKCAARVDLLRGEKKYVSSSVGRGVTIKPLDTCDVEQSHRWEWRAAVQVGLETHLRRSLRGVSDYDIRQAHDFVAGEGKKASTQELEVVIRDHSPSIRKLSDPATPTDVGSSDFGSLTENISNPSPRSANNMEESHFPCKENARRSQDTLSALRATLQGTWAGEKGETYEVQESGQEATWTCVRWNNFGSSKKYTLWYDIKSNCIAWGLDWSYFVDASEFLQDPINLQWYSGFDKSHKPRFTWQYTKPLTQSSCGSGRTNWKEHAEPTWKVKASAQAIPFRWHPAGMAAARSTRR